MDEKTRKATEQEREEGFRGSLEDVSLIVQSLAPYCHSVRELVEMVESARVNDGTLRLVMHEVTSAKEPTARR